MAITLRQQNEQERIGGRAPVMVWQDDDYAVLDDDIVIGRIYRESVPAGVKWRWFLHIMGASPDSGSADALDQATAELATCYEINR